MQKTIHQREELASTSRDLRNTFGSVHGHDTPEKKNSFQIIFWNFMRCILNYLEPFVLTNLIAAGSLKTGNFELWNCTIQITYLQKLSS